MSQAGPLDAESTNPQIPTQFNTDDGSAIPIANELNIDAETVANASFTKPHYTTGSGNTVTVNMQLGTAIAGAPADFNDAGIVSFDSSAFTVDANGFVELIGGGGAMVSLTTDIAGPVLPDGAGAIDVTGTSVFSDGTVANTLTLNVQSTENTFLLGAGAGTNSTELGPLTNGQLIIGSTGLAPVAGTLSTTTVPNATNATPIFVDTGAGTINVDLQVSTAITGAPADKNDAGIASFDDTIFTVDANGYVSSSGSLIGQTITGNTGGALSPTAGNWNIVTDNTTVDFAGSGSTLTQDFGLNNLLIGASGSSITSAVSNTSVGDNSLTAITSASYNVGMGDGSLTALQTGNQNTGIGFIALTNANGSSFNTAIGSNAMQLGATGIANSCLGMQSLQLATGPSYNTCVGYQTGLSYTTTESNNILIGSGVTGTVAETNITRIGAEQNACYIDGIDGVNVGSVATVVTESGDQLGTAVITAGTGITVTPTANVITVSSTLPDFPSLSSDEILYEPFAGLVDTSSFLNGSLGWEWSKAANGTCTGTAETSHSSIFEAQTSTTSTGDFLSYLEPLSMVLGTSTYTQRWLIKLPSLSDVTDTFTVSFGYSNLAATTDTLTDGIYFSYDYTVNSGKWVANAMSSSSLTSANSNDTVDTNWHEYKIIVNSAVSSLSFYIDDVEIANSPITTNIPSSNIHPYFRITKSAGTNDRSLYVDTFYQLNQR